MIFYDENRLLTERTLKVLEKEFEHVKKCFVTSQMQRFIDSCCKRILIVPLVSLCSTCQREKV
jgi:hypothetical protein